MDLLLVYAFKQAREHEGVGVTLAVNEQEGLYSVDHENVAR